MAGSVGSDGRFDVMCHLDELELLARLDGRSPPIDVDRILDGFSSSKSSSRIDFRCSFV